MRAIAVAGLVILGVLGACGGGGSPAPVQVAPAVTSAPTPAGGTSGGPAVTPASDYQQDYGY